MDKSGKGDINFIKVENIDNNTGAIHISQKITLEEHNGYLKRSQLKENDILFSIAGTLGRVAIVTPDILPANTNQALAIIRLKDNDLYYIKTILCGPVVKEFLRENPTVGAQPNLSLAQVGGLEIMLPPSIEEQKKIGDFFHRLDSYLSLQKEKLEKMRLLKAALLDKLFV